LRLENRWNSGDGCTSCHHLYRGVDSHVTTVGRDQAGGYDAPWSPLCSHIDNTPSRSPRRDIQSLGSFFFSFYFQVCFTLSLL